MRSHAVKIIPTTWLSNDIIVFISVKRGRFVPREPLYFVYRCTGIILVSAGHLWRLINHEKPAVRAAYIILNIHNFDTMISAIDTWSYLGNLALFYAIPLFERSVPTLGREYSFLRNPILLKIPPTVRADCQRLKSSLNCYDRGRCWWFSW